MKNEMKDNTTRVKVGSKTYTHGKYSGLGNKSFKGQVLLNATSLRNSAL